MTDEEETTGGGRTLRTEARLTRRTNHDQLRSQVTADVIHCVHCDRVSGPENGLSEVACGEQAALHHLLTAVNGGCYMLITTFASCLQTTSQCSVCLAVIR